MYITTLKNITMKIFIYASFLSTIIFACSTKNVNIERISLSPQIINDSLFTMLPGKILLCDPYIIWQDGFATDTFMYVIDLRTGKEVGKMGKIGRGPEEFIFPNLIGCINKHIIILDDNLPKCAFYSIDSLLSSRNPYIPRTDFPVKQVCDAVVIDSSSFITLQFMTPLPFQFIKSGQVVSKFGKLPISDSITNSYAALQGTLAYNPEKHVMLYSANRFPYFALYQKNVK